MTLSDPLVPPLITALAALVGIAAQCLIAYRSRQQTAKQLDLQQLVSHRATASFVADKRQKWIDELRTDMAFHLALSQEIVWKWDAMRDRAAIKVSAEAQDGKGRVDPEKANKIQQDIADAFAPENGARDREHQERHFRIMFRLNPKEALHITLRECMESIRHSIIQIQGAKSRQQAEDLMAHTSDLIAQAQRHTEAILGAEWRRVKQEVAYPDALMSKIPQPK